MMKMPDPSTSAIGSRLSVFEPRTASLRTLNHKHEEALSPRSCAHLEDVVLASHSKKWDAADDAALSAADTAVETDMQAPTSSPQSIDASECGENEDPALSHRDMAMKHSARVLAARGDFSLRDLVRAIVPFLPGRTALLLCMLLRSMLRRDLQLTVPEFEEHVQALLGDSTEVLQKFVAIVSEARVSALLFSRRPLPKRGKLARRLRLAKRRLEAKRNKD
mmetsp:Transcript_43408/g.98067  ORF Transcript_43408/g.98067 Transcript_43408/m.98067 type:complete len:221 (-) Transcript_43408:376-1038(-)